jgi:BirA family biotin operon repressor/biotin-[acetyl-CoA-carboxylase] ligase
MINATRILRETFIAQAEHHPTLGSTNDRAKQCAALGATRLPLLVVADEQTAGRGRGGNRWWTGAGGLAFSLLVDAATVAAEQERSPLVALASAAAVADALAPLASNCSIKIRWPNDVLAGDKKICGILVEVLPDRKHIIGIGLNTNNTLADAPAELHATAATLRDLRGGKPLDQTAVLIDLLKRLESRFAQLRENPAAVVERVNALCLQRDRPITIESGRQNTSGICRGIAADGALLLKTPARLERFLSGTIRVE